MQQRQGEGSGSAIIQVLLVPNANAARRLRRQLAEAGLGNGIVAATWPELLERAALSYLQPWPEDDWERCFQDALLACEDAFWLESLAVAPEETAAAVQAALLDVIAATDPLRSRFIQGQEQLPPRARRHLDDLRRLEQALAGCLPTELAMIRALLNAPPADALQRLRVLQVPGCPWLTRWQQALVDKLNDDAGRDEDNAALTDQLQWLLADHPSAPAAGALGVLQLHLFGDLDARAAVDDSLQWVGVRDALLEAEVAAGMVQSLRSAQPSLACSDIGFLIPEDAAYDRALQSAFQLAGIPLAGLPKAGGRRDLGLETIYHFLRCQEPPAPAMALAACLTSPLMPWSRRQGRALAQAVMEGERSIQAWPSQQADAQPMLALFEAGDHRPDSLVQSLQTFAALLRGGRAWNGDVKRARAAIDRLCETLQGAERIDWAELRRQVSYTSLPTDDACAFTREGVTVWRESQEAWRAVRHLIVLGFTQGHYPGPLGSDPVFSAADREAIRAACQLPLRLPAEQLQARRLRFKRQLGAVSESLTCLIPRRDGLGAALNPSESLEFMHQLFSGPGTAAERILELDVAADRAQVRQLAIAANASPQPPRALVSGDLQFPRDLLTLRLDPAGHPKPESPSGLETLMVSSLAWLLRRLRAEPQGWAPEGTDPMVLGSLAHRVFEGLFQPNQPLPDPPAIPSEVERLLEAAIKEMAPFLSAESWQLERRHLCAETVKAALAWQAMLSALKAQVLAAETWLQGTWSGIAIHGQTDLLLALPDKQLVVVDYKRATSRRRRTRMEKGYDGQASLYREMLQSGGPKPRPGGEATPQGVGPLTKATKIAVVYYLLNDQTALCDMPSKSASALPGWQVVDQDVAREANRLMQRRLKDIRSGKVRLNRDGDAAFFDQQAGVGTYALESSPLIALFTLADDQEALA